jgi:hypothetical protein
MVNSAEPMNDSTHNQGIIKLSSTTSKIPMFLRPATAALPRRRDVEMWRNEIYVGLIGAI